MKRTLCVLIIFNLTVFTSCYDEPVGDLNINYNVVDEELLNLIERIPNEGENTIECIDFNYAFTLFIFDENMEFMEAVAIFDDDQFSDVLASLDENQTISLNYPIMGTLSTGELIEINTNAELKEAIDNCTDEEFQRRCNNTLVDCWWRINALTSFPNDFEGAYFNVGSDGVVQFHYLNQVYFGTWVTLYIGESLYLNIDLNEGEGIEPFWDHNWKIDLLSDTQMEISFDDTTVLIEKDCSIDCTSDSFQVCEIDDMPGFAEFALQDYTGCIGISPLHNIVSALSFSFYETEEDATTGTNPISPSTYINIENPQTVYVRIIYFENEDLLSLSEINIEAIPCE